jgi:hypothetical protein
MMLFDAVDAADDDFDEYYETMEIKNLLFIIVCMP